MKIIFYFFCLIGVWANPVHASDSGLKLALNFISAPDYGYHIPEADKKAQFFSDDEHEMPDCRLCRDFSVTKEMDAATRIVLHPSFEWSLRSVSLVAEKAYAIRNGWRPEMDKKHSSLSGELVRLSLGQDTIECIFIITRPYYAHLGDPEAVITSGLFLNIKFTGL